MYRKSPRIYPRPHPENRAKTTSWEPVGKWYNSLVGLRGQYFHEHVILPGVLKLLDLKKNSALLDLACGQGVLERSISREIFYQGIDISPFLINSAKKMTRNPEHNFCVGDITGILPITKKDFTHASIILALQNIDRIDLVFANLKNYLKPGATVIIVLNHPCFRIPRQSSWSIDEDSKLQYRRINRYMSPLSIPVNAHPGENRSQVTWSYHQPLSYYSKILSDNGFVLQLIEEWTSDKESEGRASRMENRSRSEIPLFMAIKSLYLPNIRP